MKRKSALEDNVQYLESEWTRLWWAEQRTGMSSARTATNRAFRRYQGAARKLGLLPKPRAERGGKET